MKKQFKCIEFVFSSFKSKIVYVIKQTVVKGFDKLIFSLYLILTMYPNAFFYLC